MVSLLYHLESIVRQSTFLSLNVNYYKYLYSKVSVYKIYRENVITRRNFQNVYTFLYNRYYIKNFILFNSHQDKENAKPEVLIAIKYMFKNNYDDIDEFEQAYWNIIKRHHPETHLLYKDLDYIIQNTNIDKYEHRGLYILACHSASFRLRDKLTQDLKHHQGIRNIFTRWIKKN
jgi:hypothetical protein